MKKVLIAIMLLVVASGARAQQSGMTAIVDEANQAYASENYELAVSLYESVMNSGYESAELYFNLGNAYFKLNNIPSAILYYEKARKLDPNDENIRFNLDLANSRIIDKMEPLPEFFLRTWWKSARDLFSSDQWARYAIAGFILFLASLLAFILSKQVYLRKLSFWLAAVFLFFMMVSLIFSINSYRECSRQKTAIIFTPTVTVKSSPAEGSVDLFVIHEGTKVFITDLVEEWSEVRLANGSVGWVKTDTFRRI